MQAIAFGGRGDNAGRMTGMPRGPLEMMDDVALDLLTKITSETAKAMGDAYQPIPGEQQVAQMVADGRLGRKNGKGFYLYENGKETGLDDTITQLVPNRTKASAGLSDAELVQRMIYPMINEAALALAERVVRTPGEVDLGMIMGTGFPPFRGGLLRYADAEGPKKIVDTLEKFSAAGGGERLQPNAALIEVARKGSFY